MRNESPYFSPDFDQKFVQFSQNPLPPITSSSFQPPATSIFNLLSHSLHHPPPGLSSSLRNIFVSHQIFSLAFPSNFSAVFRPDFYDVPDNFVIPDRYYLFSYDEDGNACRNGALYARPNFERFPEAKTAIPGEGGSGDLSLFLHALISFL